jgi:ferric-dicitrate binding protein FerR (iron transport regulator)
MKTKLSQALLTTACLLTTLPASTFAAEFLQAEITRVSNDVKVLKANAAPKAAAVGLKLDPVSSIATGPDARAELRFPDKTLTRLGANSRFTLKGQSRTLDLNEGTMMLQVPKNQGGAKVRTAGVTAAVTGTTVLIEYHPGGVIKFIVIEGESALFLNKKTGISQIVKAGQMISMKDGDSSIPPPQDVDLAKLLKSSKLISLNDPSQPNQRQISDAVGVQERLIKDGDLVNGDFDIPEIGLSIGLSNNTRTNIINQPEVHHEPELQ